MYLLYSLLILMTASGVCLLAVPFIATHSIASKYFFLSALFIILFSMGLYQFSSDHTALKQWLTHGKKHYQLQQEVNQLGGIGGIIQRIKKKLAANPEDVAGWFILGKLYLANQDYDEAKKSLDKAYKLRPHDPQIKHFYEVAVEKAQE